MPLADFECRNRMMWREIAWVHGKDGVVDAGHPEVRLTLEWFANVVDPMRAVVQEFDDSEDEVLRLVQRVQNLVACDRHRRSAADPALDLDEPELAAVRHAAFDVVPKLLELPVGRVEPETPLGLHDDAAGAGGRFLRIDGRSRAHRFPPAHCIDEPPGHDQQSAKDDRRQRRDLGFELEFLQPFTQTRLQHVRALAGLARIETGTRLAGLLLQLQFLGPMVPVSREVRTSTRCSGTTLATA